MSGLLGGDDDNEVYGGLLGGGQRPRWANSANELAMLFAAMSAPPHQRGQALQQAIAANAAGQDRQRLRGLQEAQFGRQNQRDKAYQSGVDQAGIPEHLRPLLRGMGPEQAARLLPGILDQAAYERASGGGAPAPAAAGGGQTMGKPQPMASGDDEDMMARTIIGEAGNQGPEGMAAVAGVIANRARLTGMSPGQVVQAPGQFEPWQTRRAELMAIRPDDPRYIQARQIARGVLSGQIPSPAGTATHFLNADTVRQRTGGALPAWAQGEGQRIGAHTFFSRPQDFPDPDRMAQPRQNPVPNSVGDIPAQDAGAMPGAMAPGGAPRGPRGDAAGAGVGLGPADFIAEARRLQARAAQLRGGGAIGRTEAHQLEQQALQLMSLAQRSEPPLSVEDRIRIAQAGRTNVTQNAEVRGENRFEAQMAEDLAKRVAEWTAAGPRASMTEARLQRFDQLNQQFQTGAMANTRLSIGQIAQQLGVGNSVLESLGMSRETVAAGEGIRAIAGQLLMGQIGPGGFPANNFSEGDRKMLERAMPGLSNTPQGNRVAADVLRLHVTRDREVAAAWRDWVRQNGRTQASTIRFELERLPQITERDMPELVGLLDAVGVGPERPMAGPGGQGTADPPPPGEGTIIRNPRTGQRRQFRGGSWVDMP